MLREGRLERKARDVGVEGRDLGEKGRGGEGEDKKRPE